MSQAPHTSDTKSASAWSLQDKRFFILLGLGMFLVSCIILLVAVYLFISTPKTNPTAPADTAAVMLQVGRLVDLPSKETAQVIPITDLAPFQQQPFFDRARTGDVLIVYLQNHLAILYNPEIHKIINMSKITVLLPKPAALP